MDPKEYKKFHEAAMSNNSGTTLEMTFLCVLFGCLSSIIVTIGREHRSHCYQLIIEYVCFILPIVFAYTILAAHIYDITKIMVALLYIQSVYHLNRQTVLQSFRRINIFGHERMQCITSFRGLTYIMTVLCIFAVDFACFPRMFAKTERRGFSLMDTGVGFFTIASGLVHKTYQNPNILVVLRDNYKLIIVPVMGLGRMLLVKSFDYHEHVTEYGTHWNYFFTLAAAKFVSTLILHITPRLLELPVCALILGVHQKILLSGWDKWVFSEVDRDTFVNANREGIASILGYVVLYIFGVFIKGVLTDKKKARWMVLAKLLIIWMNTFLAMFQTGLFLPVSRTLANVGYCIYIANIFIAIITLLYISEVILNEYQGSLVPCIIDAFNLNGLFLFILANLFTGIFNMLFQTLLFSDMVAITILCSYMTLLILIALFLKKHSIIVL